MSLANYTVPFTAPVQTGGYYTPHQAAAINSLLYDTPRYSPTRRTYFPPSPSRQHPLTQRKVKDNRDPYRNQYPKPGNRKSGQSSESATASQRKKPEYDDYFSEPDYDSDKDTDYDKHYHESEPGKSQQPPQHVEKPVRGAKRRVPVTTPQQQQPQQQQPRQANSRDWPNRPPTFKRIANTFNSVPEPGAKTTLHAVLDFDDDFDEGEYVDEDADVEPVAPTPPNSPKMQVTPIEGPIYVKNGSVPVVPLYSYPTVRNGTLVQIPILWTALSLALGLEIHGEVIRGVPCIKRFHQLFCPTAGNSYPIERIERFIDDNKALMKRMYGEFQMADFGPPAREIFQSKRNSKRQAKGPEGSEGPGEGPRGSDSYFAKHRVPRQSFRGGQNGSGRVDACESKVEIVTPYWASNSAGKIRAIVNTQHFEQAIHQEVCSKVQTKRCVGDCGCEQKYKWHRLLAYDPDNDCKGIFMDWFLFPSCCVCRCAPTFGH